MEGGGEREDRPVVPVDSDPQQVIAIAESLYKLFEIGLIAAIEVKLRRTRQAIAKRFRLALKIAAERILLGLDFVP